MTGVINLEARNLTIGYHSKVIQQGLNLKLFRGDLICLLGQNGVGKSTLLKTLGGLLPPKEGEVLLNRESIRSISKQDLARSISMVSTERLTAGGLSVMDVLMAGRYPYQTWIDSPNHLDFEKIQEAIDLTRISYLVDKRIAELSDGQRQKIMIARALVQGGKTILLDEPTAHLDLRNRVEVMKLLRKISSEEQKTILVSTHELNLALQFSDRLWLMDFGEKLMDGAPEDLAISGDLDKIFHHEDFEYDLITGRISSEAADEKITIDAEDEISFWINNALHRRGISTAAPVKISAKTTRNVLQWETTDGINSYNGVTIIDLLETLSKNF